MQSQRKANNVNEDSLGMVIKSRTGEVEKTLYLSGPRFNHAELFESSDMSTFREKYNGWVIMESLIDTILFFRPFTVVEIGCGLSTEILLPAAVRADVDYHGVDINIQKEEYFKAAANKAGPGHYQFHYMASNTFMETFDDTVSVVLIDANHEYTQAKTEFDFFFNLLIPGGVIFLHDTFPADEYLLRPSACYDVYRLRQELELRTDEMDCFTWPYTAGYSGLTMVIKKDPDRPYWGK